MTWARWGVVLTALCVSACGNDPLTADGTVLFTDESINLGETGTQGVVSGQVQYKNTNIEELREISFRGEGVPEGLGVGMIPGSWGRMKPGRTLSSSLTLTGGRLTPGEYEFAILLLVEGVQTDRLEVRFRRK